MPPHGFEHGPKQAQQFLYTIALRKSFVKIILAFCLEWLPDYLRIGDHPFSFVRLTCGSHLSATGEEGLGPFPTHLATKAAGGAS